MRLYIADDNTDFSSFLAEVATAGGWQVSLHENGMDLLNSLKQENGAALVICDIQMPELDGMDVAYHMPTIKRYLRIRFITGGPHADALAARLIADANDLNVGRFLTKPITLSAFKEVLAEEAKLLAAAV